MGNTWGGNWLSRRADGMSARWLRFYAALKTEKETAGQPASCSLPRLTQLCWFRSLLTTAPCVFGLVQGFIGGSKQAGRSEAWIGGILVP